MNKITNRLVILAHPSKKSFNHKIAMKILENSNSVFLMNLYDNEWRQDFLEFQDMKTDWPSDVKFKKIREKIKWADELIFVFPNWWSSVPAILKNFIDVNFSSGFAFEYVNGIPRPLLKNKKARIFITADTPVFLMFFKKFHIKNVIVNDILKFVGIDTIVFKIFSSMNNKKDKKSRDKMLKEVVRLLN